MKYLIYFDSTLGNFTHLIPNLVYLKKCKINFKILILDPIVKELSIHLGFSKNLIYLSKNKNLLLKSYSIAKLLGILNIRKFDIFINLSLHNQWKNKIFNKLITSNKKYYFVFKKSEKRYSNSNLFLYNKKKSEAINYKNFFEFILNKKIIFQISKKKKKTKNNIIGLHTGSSNSLSFKRWDKKNFIELIKKLINKNYNIYLFGKGAEESNINNAISKQVNSKKLTNYTNKLNLKKLILYIQKCELIISNDSGIMQLSSLYNIPTIGIFGPTSEIKNRPINKGFKALRAFSNNYCNKYTNMVCKNCKLYKKYKVQTKCLERVTTNLIYSKTTKILNA